MQELSLDEIKQILSGTDRFTFETVADKGEPWETIMVWDSYYEEELFIKPQQTIKTLMKYIIDQIHKESYEQGKRHVQSEIKKLLDLN